MKKEKFIILLSLFLISFGISSVSAVDVAPRISDREIVEKLSEIKEGQKNLDKRFDDLRLEMNNRFEAVDKRFEAVDKRFEAVDKRFDDLHLEMNNRFDDLRSEINSRFDMLTWILGLFVTIALIIFGFVIRIQWEMQKRQTHVETSLETQKDEMSFLKGLIEKLMPPKGAL